MKKTFALKTRCRVQRALWLAVAVVSMLFPRTSHAWQQQQQQPQQQQQQAQQQDDSLSAEQVIEILQNNPEVLAEAKKEIVARLRDRGYSVTEADITDDRLFSQIQGDDRVRLALSSELKARGFGQPQQEESTPARNTSAGSGQRPANGATAPSAGTGNTGMTQGNTANVPMDRDNMQEREAEKKPASGRRREEQGSERKPGTPRSYIYRNLPALQDLYTQSLVDPTKLERFGAALFRNSNINITDKTSGDIPVGSDYVLGPGDQISVDYFGSVTQKLQLTVDRSGRVVLPDAGPVLVAGRTLDEAQQRIHDALARQYRNITVDVSLARLRTVRVYVVGDVKNPGAYETSALSTVLNALLMAGGPTETGSLRTVKHFRGKQLVAEVDLYDLMLHGVTSGIEQLESGDSILVPPTGTQVTVAGMVRRPAIYEIRNEKTLDEVLQLAGGVPVTGELSKVKVERIQAHEHKEMLNVDVPKDGNLQGVEAAIRKFPVQDGDRITITPILPRVDQTIYLQGHVFRPGKYPYRDGLRVTDVIGSFNDLMPEPADRAEIVRLRPPDYRPSVIGFNLREVLSGQAAAPELQPFDTIHVFGRYEEDAPKVGIYGEVLRPGEYPLSEHMTASDLLRLAGGFRRSAFTDSADLASYAIRNGSRVELQHREVAVSKAVSGETDADVLLKPGDVLTVRQLGNWTSIGGAISITGQILHPGRYGIQEGERLSSVLRRAGGFLGEAYPYGAVLERDQVKELASKNRDELVRKLQTQAAEVDPSGKPEPAAVVRQRQQLIDKLKQIQPSGRLLIHISPEVEKWEGSSVDIEVRPGDTLLIPRRPNFVLVAGQVYSPTAITFSRGRHASWYLRQAGGATSLGNRKDIFVIRANGTVIGKSGSQWWSGNVLNTVLQPGDTVFVPEKFNSGDRLKIFAESAQVLSGLAVAARVAISF